MPALATRASTGSANVGMLVGFFILSPYDELLTILDVHAWLETLGIDTATVEGIDGVECRVLGAECRESDVTLQTQGAEGEVDGIVVLGRKGVVQVLARVLVLQREALAGHIADFPNGSVLYVLTVLVVQSENEAAVGLSGESVQIAGAAPDAVLRTAWRDEAQQIAASHLFQLEVTEETTPDPNSISEV